MTLIWCLSPLIGFFLTPILGSLSDRCRSTLGRRRPFIILLSIGVVIGLLLVPNGKLIGKKLGDRYPLEERLEEHTKGPGGRMTALIAESNSTLIQEELHGEHASHPWGVFFTVLGTVLLDFDADACQSPSRAYLLDVTLPGNPSMASHNMRKSNTCKSAWLICMHWKNVSFLRIHNSNAISLQRIMPSASLPLPSWLVSVALWAMSWGLLIGVP